MSSALLRIDQVSIHCLESLAPASGFLAEWNSLRYQLARMNLEHADILTQFISSQSFYPCLLLVSPDVQKLGRMVAELANRDTYPIIDVARLLSPLLIPLPKTAYSSTAITSLRSTLQKQSAPVLILNQIDILFEPIFQLDPLSVVKHAAHQIGKHLIIAWPGTYTNGRLAYAVPEHSHYRIWSQPEIDYIIQL